MNHRVAGMRNHDYLLFSVSFLFLVIFCTIGSNAFANSPIETPDNTAVSDGSSVVSSIDKSSDVEKQAKAGTEPDLAKSNSDNQESSLGDPKAPAIIGLLKGEIIDGLKRRNILPNFARFRAYSRYKLDDTAGDRRTSEVTGNCRLNWYDHIMRYPLKATPEAEEFTRVLHKDLVDHSEGLDRALVTAGKKLDLATKPQKPIAPVNTPQEAIEVIRQALTATQVAHAAALAPLTTAEVNSLARNLHQILTRNGNNGHTLADRGTGRYMCDLLEKADRRHWITAARELVPLTDEKFLDQLAKLPDDEEITVEGITGKVIRRINTPSGDIIIGGRGKNTYQLDAIPNVHAVIDLGGNDRYYDGTCSINRPVMIVIDLAGNDRYQSKLPGVQGGAVLGISMLLDREGNDYYQGIDVAQGSCLGGAGMLIDYAGDDIYVGVRRIQGQAIGGVGLLVDRDGNDKYRGAMWSQGLGGPLGFAVLDDLNGKDHYFAGGLYYDSYEETPGYDGWGQGIGTGIRQVADGGVGVILDGGGDDLYEYDYLSHGGGYWLGLGFARDFGGNDQRIGATRETFSGKPRTERRFQRFSNGFGCHYAAGFLFDDAGDDVYGGTIMCVGFAWDVAIGVLCDFGGKDVYAGTEGNGAQAGLGILYDYAGDDVYRGYRQGRASGSISYHDLPYCGGNFSFVVDYGGTDKYGCGARNNSYLMRSSSGGFLIDRPKESELKKSQTAAKDTQTTQAEPKR